MARPKKIVPLSIYINGEIVGTLSFTTSKQMQVTYDQRWLQSENCRPLSLSLPLTEQALTGQTVESFFDNLLPDNSEIRRRIQTRFGAATDRCFDLLWHIGRDCIGAVQLIPETEACPEVTGITATPLTDAEIAATLLNYRTIPLGMTGTNDFRISLAGAQEKSAFLWHEDRWCRPSGTTPTSHIFKLPIGQIPQLDLRDSVENEWLCHLILKAYDLPVADAEMLVFDGVKVLSVKRFDRKRSIDGSWVIRLPQEDMCQALAVPPAFKYESDGGPGIKPIMDLLYGSTSASQDRRTFMKAQLVYWLIAGIDGHAKNYSIFLLPGGGYQLTPLYDVLSAYPLLARKSLHTKQLKMALSVDGKNKHYDWDTIYPRHWLAQAKKVKFSQKELTGLLEEIIDTTDQVVSIVTAQLPASFPSELADPVFAGMRKALRRLRVTD